MKKNNSLSYGIIISVSLVLQFIESLYGVIYIEAGIYDLIRLFVINTAFLFFLMLCLYGMSILLKPGAYLKRWLFLIAGAIIIFVNLLHYLIPILYRTGYSGLLFIIIISLLFAISLAMMIPFVKFGKGISFSRRFALYLFPAWGLTLLLIILWPAGEESRAETISSQGKRKNVILFTVDTLRKDYLEKGRIENLSLPAIREFEKNSLTFENYFSVANTTNPSFASLFTAKYPDEHGLFLNGYTLDHKTHKTLAEIMRSKGYATAAFSENVKYDSGLGQGFRYFYHVRKGATVNGRYIKFRGALEKLYYKFKKRVAGQDIVSLAQKWVDKNKRASIFLWVHIYDTHLPYNPPGHIKKDFVSKDAPYKRLSVKERWRIYNDKVVLSPGEIANIRALYTGEVKYADSRFAGFLKFLKESGLYEDSLVIFSSDHGEALYEKDSWIGHSLFLFDNTIRIPLILKPPSGVKISEEICSNNYSNLYLAQSILDIAGIEENISHLSFLKDKNNPLLNDAFSFMFEDCEGGVKLARIALSRGGKMVIYDGSSLRYMVTNRPGEKEVDRATFMDADLEEKVINMFKEKNKKFKKQKISREERERLKSLGYIN